MPKQEEIATVTINGATYRDWDSVHVTRQAGGKEGGLAICQLSVTEKVGGSITYATLQVKPGDKATVSLAGHQVCNGFVTERQASYDSRNHGVLVVIKSVVTDLVDTEVPMKATQFRNYGLSAIVKNLIKPYGLNLKIENPSKNFDKPFPDVSPIPGESVFAFIERMARYRGMQVHDNENGELVLASGTTGSGGDLVEGQNILSANCLISNESAFSTIGTMGQMRGGDNTPDEIARKPAGTTKGPSDRYRPHLVIAEHPGDADDMAFRSAYEAATLDGDIVNARVTVQGWLQPSGDLWRVRQDVVVQSPMLLLYGFPLCVNSVVFSQDNGSGTQTTLELKQPGAMGAIGRDNGLPGSNSYEGQAEV